MVADFVLLSGIYVVRLILERETLAENENLLGAGRACLGMRW